MGRYREYFFHIFLGLLSIMCFSSNVRGAANIVPPGLDVSAAPAASGTGIQSYSFDPNQYSFLVYDPTGGDSGSDIRRAMNKLQIYNYDLRTSAAGNHVTLSDLNTHDILIVGWNEDGDMSGLDSAVFASADLGRVILTGQDADYHVANTLSRTPKARVFFSQAIGYVLNGSRTGIVALGDYAEGFKWLPASWGITTNYGLKRELIQSFSTEGLASGVFDGITPDELSDWFESYHNTFETWGFAFVPFVWGGTANDPNSEVVTLAAQLTPASIQMTKTDDVSEGDCRGIGDSITYTISWSNPSSQAYYDVRLMDYLPAGTSYSVSQLFDPNTMTLYSSDPNYNEQDHTYAWAIGTISGYGSGSRSLTVEVSDMAEPGVALRNAAELFADEILIAQATKETLVCCRADRTLYVDEIAAGNNTGFSWADAFVSLQDALHYARNAPCPVEQIWVAQGPYSPGTDEGDSFELPDNISVYGGFPTGGCEFSQRDPKRYPTILSGRINDTERNEKIVKMGNNTLLDGFTVTESSRDGAGVFASGVDFTVENCTIEQHGDYGVYVENGNAVFRWTIIRNNGSDGIYHEGEGFELVVENCWIRQNMQYGINCLNSTPIVFNSIVTESDMAEEGRAGILMFNPDSSPVLYNNTIAHNKAEGISLVGTTLPDVQNCIVYYNNGGGAQLAGFSADTSAAYCCIQGCNSINNNINIDPMFAYFDPNNVRIMSDSPCHDSGLTLQENYTQMDMDNRTRVMGNAVDRGAYEIECEDTSNLYDLNADGLVNLSEFNGFSRAWLSHDPNDPAWLADPNVADPNLSEGWYEWKYRYNLDTSNGSTYTVDLMDLMAWVEESPWLWRACWKTEFYQTESSQPMATMLTDEISVLTAQTETVLTAQVIEEKPARQQMAELAAAIGFLQQIWLDEPDLRQQISEEDWRCFMESVYQNYKDLRTSKVGLE